VHAGVTDRAPEAASLYRDLGFAVWGVEPAAMRIGGEDVAEAHLILDLSRTE
jgi:hypothetical protein